MQYLSCYGIRHNICVLCSDVHILLTMWCICSGTSPAYASYQSSILYFSTLCACVSIPSTASPSVEKRGGGNGKQFFSVSTDVAIL